MAGNSRPTQAFPTQENERGNVPPIYEHADYQYLQQQLHRLQYLQFHQQLHPEHQLPPAAQPVPLPVTLAGGPAAAPPVAPQGALLGGQPDVLPPVPAGVQPVREVAPGTVPQGAVQRAPAEGQSLPPQVDPPVAQPVDLPPPPKALPAAPQGLPPLVEPPAAPQGVPPPPRALPAALQGLPLLVEPPAAPQGVPPPPRALPAAPHLYQHRPQLHQYAPPPQEHHYASAPQQHQNAQTLQQQYAPLQPHQYAPPPHQHQYAPPPHLYALPQHQPNALPQPQYAPPQYQYGPPMEQGHWDDDEYTIAKWNQFLAQERAAGNGRARRFSGGRFRGGYKGGRSWGFNNKNNKKCPLCKRR